MNIINDVLKYIMKTKYNIGFVENNIEDIIDGKPIKVHWLVHNYKDRWFADPFILDITEDEIILLVEEWYDYIHRGRITKLIVNKINFKLKNLKVVLELDSHLSFPAIEKINGCIYIHPENSSSSVHKMYKYNSEIDYFQECAILCNEPLTDTICTELFENRKIIFSTKLPDANGKELGIYELDDNNKYKIIEVIHFTENISRMAGNLFEYNGKIYRPAQVCIKSYGDAISLQEVSLENGKWNFKEIRRIYSPSKKLNLGFHTFNLYQDTIVVDGLGFRHSILCHILLQIKIFMKKVYLR